MKRAPPLMVLLALGAWTGCTVEGHGLQRPDASAAGGGGGVSPAGGVTASGGASGPGGDSGGALGDTGAPVTDGEARSDDAPQSGDIPGSGGVAGADVASGSGGSSGSDAGAGADVASGSGGTSGSDAIAGEDVASGSGGTSGSDAEVDAVDAPQGGSSGSDAGMDADGASDSGGTWGSDAGLGSIDGASNDGVSGKDAGFDSGPNWQLIWSDEFEGLALTGADTNKWNVVTWEPNTVNGEQQKYTARVENIFHDGNGHLVLRGLDTPWTSNGTTYQYTSGRLQTDGDKFQFSFGRVEVRAKLPAGQGSFPAIVLMGTTGNWPQCGEIGMMEQLGQDKSWLYCSTYSGASSDIRTQVTFPNATTLSSDFHVYALEWYSDHMVFFIDDVQVAQSNFDTTSPFYTGTFYIILDVAIGGSMGGTIGDASAFPMDMVLDYVRVYSQ